MTLREKAMLAEKAARASGAMLEHHGAFKVRRKAENDFVTEMDYKSEALIREMLLTACPEDAFFGEETGGPDRAQGRWIVDPIDGTTNFMRGERLYTISIAYEKQGQLCVGCVYCPATDELFLGVRGEGATLNGQPIHVSRTEELHDAVIHMGFGHRVRGNMERTLDVFPRLMPARRRAPQRHRRLRPVLRGRRALRRLRGAGPQIYDLAAGYVILTEAGGRFTGWDEGDDGASTGNVLATNGLLHAAIRDILKR